MNRFLVISVTEVPGRNDALVVLEVLEGSVEAVEGRLFGEDGLSWHLATVALHEPQMPSLPSNRRMVGLEGECMPEIGSVLVNW